MCLVLPHRMAINCKLILQNFRHFFPVHCKMCSTLQLDLLCVKESMTASPLTSVTFYTGCLCSNALNIRSVYLSLSAFTRQLHCIWLRCAYQSQQFSGDMVYGQQTAVRGDLEVPRCNLARYGQLSFYVSGPSLWNSLPLTVRDSSLTLKQFCTRLKTFLFTRAYGTSP